MTIGPWHGWVGNALRMLQTRPTRTPGENGKCREVQSGLHWPGLLRGMCTNVFSHCFLCFVGICDSFPVVANRTDGCTSNYANWADGEPNNGAQTDIPALETVAAVIFQNVTIGNNPPTNVEGEIYDDGAGHVRPAIYECCGTCAPTPAPTEVST